MRGLIEGRCIHYVAYNGRHLAGMVIGVVEPERGTINLVLFTDMPNAAGKPNFGVQFHQGVEYSATAEPGTWHFIEQA